MCQVREMAMALPNQALQTTRSDPSRICTPPSGRCMLMLLMCSAVSAGGCIDDWHVFFKVHLYLMRVPAPSFISSASLHTTQVPPHCIPIHANVATYDWHGLAKALQFDVIMMDPPWALATANPTRGAAIQVLQLADLLLCILLIYSASAIG